MKSGKLIASLLVAVVAAGSLMAAAAYRGWYTYTGTLVMQHDGSKFFVPILDGAFSAYEDEVNGTHDIAYNLGCTVRYQLLLNRPVGSAAMAPRRIGAGVIDYDCEDPGDNIGGTVDGGKLVFKLNSKGKRVILGQIKATVDYNGDFTSRDTHVIRGRHL